MFDWAGGTLGSWKMSLSTYLIEGVMVVIKLISFFKYFSYPELSLLPCCDLAVVTRRWLAISVINDYLKTRFFDLEMLIT